MAGAAGRAVVTSAAAAAGGLGRGVASRAELEGMSAAALVQRVLDLQERLAGSGRGRAEPAVEATPGKGRKRQREFDFDRHHTRHVALRVAYLGMRYDGLARQDSTSETIEVGTGTEMVGVVAPRKMAAHTRPGAALSV
jgi:hypothetical protein